MKKCFEPRDYQRQKVYNWGYQYFYKFEDEFLSLNYCALLTEDVLKAYQIQHSIKSEPRRIGVKPTTATFYQGKQKISYGEKMQYRCVVLHETAHALCRFWFGRKISSHG